MLLALILALLAIDCNCDPTKPETMAERRCSLCGVAEKQPAGTTVFILKDNNPNKPNRWLALPKAHCAAAHHLHEMTLTARTELWNAALDEAQKRFGSDWGLAYNGEQVRTQCHTHIHIGRFNPLAEQKQNVLIVTNASEIPAAPGEGIWVHPVNGKLHVHTGEQTVETVLLR